MIEEDVQEQDEYVVEEIVDVRYNKRTSRLLYQIKWLGYSSEENTWEPEEHLGHCPLILRNFKLSDKFKDYVEHARARGHNLSDEDLSLPELPPAVALPIPDTNEIRGDIELAATKYPRVVGACRNNEGNTEYIVCLAPDSKPKRMRRAEVTDLCKEELFDFLEKRLIDKKVFTKYLDAIDD